jgi:uncharacterized protein
VTTNTLALYTAVALACVLTGLSKSGLGGTIGFLIVPMLSLVMPLNTAVGLLLPILIIGDVFVLAAYWRKWDSRHVAVLMAGGLAGVIVGTFMLTSISPSLLKRSLGLMVLLFGLYKIFESRLQRGVTYIWRAWHAVLAGSVAGFTSTLAAAGGPPITMYLLFQRMTPVVFIATSGLFFAILNWLKVPFYFFNGIFDFALMQRMLWLAPLVLVGVWLGKVLVRHIDRVQFEWLILVLLIVSGIVLLIKG